MVTGAAGGPDQAAQINAKALRTVDLRMFDARCDLMRRLLVPLVESVGSAHGRSADGFDYAAYRYPVVQPAPDTRIGISNTIE